MRTIFLTLLIALCLTACGGKNTAPDADNATAQNATVAEGEGLGDLMLNIQLEPIGVFILKDGTTIPVLEFEKIGKYYIYIDGKLDGRASTVISLTRQDDMIHWAGIAFHDPTNFLIVTRKEKQLEFSDARIFIGSDSYETFRFITSGENYTSKPIEVKKEDVATIKLTFKKPE